MEIGNMVVANNITSFSLQVMNYLNESFWFFSPYIVSCREMRLYSNFVLRYGRVVISIQTGNRFSLSMSYAGTELYSNSFSPCIIQGRELYKLTLILEQIRG